MRDRYLLPPFEHKDKTPLWAVLTLACENVAQEVREWHERRQAKLRGAVNWPDVVRAMLARKD